MAMALFANAGVTTLSVKENDTFSIPIKAASPTTIQKRLCPLLPDFIEASLLKIIWSHDDSESTLALKVRNQGSARVGIFEGSDISTIMMAPR